MPAKNVMGQYTYLAPEVFAEVWGWEWDEQRVARKRTMWDFSGDQFALETLEGPETGLMHPDLQRSFVTTLNISGNQLTEIECLNRRSSKDNQEFSKLQVLVASKNQLTQCRLQIESLLELNLSRNQLTLLPDCSAMPNLTTLIVSHNQIDGNLRESIGSNTKLTRLDLSANAFSWKPTVFKQQLDLLATGFYIQSLKLYPNPFATHFLEYQFLAVARLDGLVELDRHRVDRELRNELRAKKEAMMPTDYTLFDVWVEKRKASSVGKDDAQVRVNPTQVPSLEDLIDVLQKPLDFPQQLVDRIAEFDTLVSKVWGASIPNRRQLLTSSGRAMSEENLVTHVNEFVDKMMMVLQRFDSAQEVLVRCLVRLCASGYAPLSCRCATILAEWIEGLPPETKANLRRVSGPLFKELRRKMVPGIQSLCESPKDCYDASQAKPGADGLVSKRLSGTVEEIEECAGILEALSTFSMPMYARKLQPWRAVVLLPFVPALCRLTREERSQHEGKPDGDFIVYYDMESCTDETGPDETLEVQGVGVEVLRQKCKMKGNGGFVMYNSLGRPGFVTAAFINQAPEVITGLRRHSPGKILHVVDNRSAAPSDNKRARGLADSSVAKVRTWDVWFFGLVVLTLAADDPDNAALCVTVYQMHKVVYAQIQQYFTDTWVLVSNEAMHALVHMLHLIIGLMRASGTAGKEAREWLIEKKLHVDLFMRIRRRLTENGNPLPLNVLAGKDVTFCSVIAALVGVVTEMAVHKKHRDQGIDEEPAEGVMRDLAEATHTDTFYLLLDIAAATDVPDPLLLASSLESIWLYIESSFTRKEVIGKVLQELHDSAVLLPYVRGPKHKDADNAKYIDLWFKCETKYCMDPLRHWEIAAKADLEELKTRAPALKDLQHPLMHRVLLGIVALIEQFSRKAKEDLSGALGKATEILDANNREELLIGPAGGVVLVPDWDVKIECVKTIKHVLAMNPQQFEQQEMGWLLRYLNSTGIGMGNQEAFLTHVLELIIMLVTHESRTGHKFRQQFAKAAIRESFEMLRVNSLRDVESDKEAEAKKLKLSRTICEFLQICSRPLSGNLRPFLRRVELLKKVCSTIEAEDRHERKSVRSRLLASWTGRSIREVLLPLATGNSLSLFRLGRLRALVRVADVLQGRPDYIIVENLKAGVAPNEHREFQNLLTGDEVHLWRGLRDMRRLALRRDPKEREDFEKQQEEFTFQDGYRQLLEYSERFFSQWDQSKSHTATHLLEEWLLDAKAFSTSVISSAGGAIQDAREAVDQVKPDGSKEEGYSSVADCIEKRLQVLNDKVIKIYQVNLNRFAEGNQGERGKSCLRSLAVEFADLFAQHHRSVEEWATDYSMKALQQMENEYPTGNSFSSQKLERESQIHEQGYHVLPVRQHTNDLSEMLKEASEGVQLLKGSLIFKEEGGDTKAADDWAQNVYVGAQDGLTMTEHKRMDSNLASFLKGRDWTATVDDMGLQAEEIIMRKQDFKYRGDFTRVKDMVKLQIKYDTPKQMLDSIKEMKNTRRITVVKIKNLYKEPPGLGERKVRISVMLGGDVPHFAELQLMLASQDRHGKAIRDTMQRIRDVLTKKVGLAGAAVDEVQGYLSYQLDSRTVRSMDVVYLQCDSSTMRTVVVSGDNRLSITEGLENGSLWVLERENGDGPLRTGDVIRLMHKETHLYIDTTSTNPRSAKIHARYKSLEADAQFNFIVEAAPQSSSNDGTIFSGLTSSLMEGSSHQPQHGDRRHFPPRNVRSITRVRFRIPETTLFLTLPHVAQGISFSFHGGDNMVLRGTSVVDDGERQAFTIVPQGALDQYYALEANLSDPPITCVDPTMAPQQRSKETLLRAYMMSGSSAAQTAPMEQGRFRRSPLRFQAVAEKLLGVVNEHYYKSTIKDESILDRDAAPNLAMSAIFRCFYAAIEVSVFSELKCLAINELLGQPDDPGELQRILHQSIAALISDDSPAKFDTTRLLVGGMVAKSLRTFTAVLRHAPLQSEAAVPSVTSATALLDAAETMGHMKPRNVKDFEKDTHRLKTLYLLASYLNFVAEPLHGRLSTSAQNDLNHEEIVLLKEFVTMIDHIVHVLFMNEFRTESKEATKETSWFALTDGESARGSSMAPGQKQDHKLPMAFTQLISGRVCRVLVQTCLYAMHLEQIVYEKAHTLGNLDGKVISSLIERSIYALAVVMYGGASLHWDYNVCEAISHAVSSKVQVVARPRVTQLMREWQTECLRKSIQQLVDEMEAKAPSKPLGVIMHLAFAYVATSKDPTKMNPRLLAITSRLVLLVFRVPDSLSSHSEDNFGFTSRTAFGSGSQPIEVLQEAIELETHCMHIYLHPRMRQLMGMCWYDKADHAMGKELWIFESSTRRTQFREALLLIRPEAASKKDVQEDMKAKLKNEKLHAMSDEYLLLYRHELPVSGRLTHTIVEASETKPSEGKLVSITFIKSASSVSSADPFQVLVMTRDYVTIIYMHSFLDLFWASVADESGLMEPVLVDDSDSDDEALPENIQEASGSDLKEIQTASKRWKISSLQGVWFLADAQPTILVQFAEDSQVQIVFFSDGDRKRWRQQLNSIITARQQADWSVMPTGKTELAEVAAAANTAAKNAH